MSLKAGLVGLPNVGKSTLFNAITNSNAEVANYPFATIESNVGIVELKDERIIKLAKIIEPQKITFANFKFIDIAGLVKGANKGEGLGNKFLNNIRDVDVIVHVVRLFENKNIIHVNNNIDPINDVNTINFELLMADINSVEKMYEKQKKLLKSTKDTIFKRQFLLLERIFQKLKKEIPVRNIELNNEEKDIVKNWNLLTFKPILYVANIDEKFIYEPEKSKYFNELKKITNSENEILFTISAAMELEISKLNEEEQKIFLKDLNLNESGLNILIKNTFKLLNLATYFTAGIKEVKAWTYKLGMKAPECAGIIHSDFQRGFIKAEIIKYEDFIKYNGFNKAKEMGKIRLEGKDYIVQDADIINFKFNV